MTYARTYVFGRGTHLICGSELCECTAATTTYSHAAGSSPLTSATRTRLVVLHQRFSNFFATENPLDTEIEPRIVKEKIMSACQLDPLRNALRLHDFMITLHRIVNVSSATLCNFVSGRYGQNVHKCDSLTNYCSIILSTFDLWFRCVRGSPPPIVVVLNHFRAATSPKRKKNSSTLR